MEESPTSIKVKKVSISLGELIELIDLESYVEEPLKISMDLADELAAADGSATFLRVAHQVSPELWLTKHYKASYERHKKQKEEQEKNRRLWNLTTEAKAELKQLVMKRLGLEDEAAALLASMMVSGKRLDKAALFGVDLAKKYPELL